MMKLMVLHMKMVLHNVFFVTFNDEIDGIIKKSIFKYRYEVMKEILAKKVITDNQGVMLEISLQQVSGFDLETRIENK